MTTMDAREPKSTRAREDARNGSRADHRVLLPAGWPRPRGYANGVLAEGRMIFVAGQVGWDREGRFSDDFATQFRQTLENTMAVLEAGGAGAEHVVRMTWYITDLDRYRAALDAIGTHYREVMGRHYPAMAVVEVKGLVEPRAMIEIETTAVLPY